MTLFITGASKFCLRVADRQAKFGFVSVRSKKMPAVIVTSKKCPLVSTVAGKKLFRALYFATRKNFASTWESQRTARLPGYTLLGNQFPTSRTAA